MLTRLLEDREFRNENRDRIRELFTDEILLDILDVMQEEAVEKLSTVMTDNWSNNAKNCIIARLQVIREFKASLRQLNNAVDTDDGEDDE